MTLVAWPELDELKQLINIGTTDAWDGDNPYDFGPTRLSRLLAAAIAFVKAYVGDWNEYEDEPDEQLAQGALRMAELMALRPGIVAEQLARDPTFQACMYGHRRRFGVA